MNLHNDDWAGKSKIGLSPLKWHHRLNVTCSYAAEQRKVESNTWTSFTQRNCTCKILHAYLLINPLFFFVYCLESIHIWIGRAWCVIKSPSDDGRIVCIAVSFFHVYIGTSGLLTMFLSSHYMAFRVFTTHSSSPNENVKFNMLGRFDTSISNGQCWVAPEKKPPCLNCS